MKTLLNKRAIITGAAQGIGLATAQLFAHHGARLLLVDHDEQALSAVTSCFDPENTRFMTADVSQEAATQQYADYAKSQFGGVDIFVNNAGIEGAVNPIIDYASDQFDRVMAVNVRGVWLGLKYIMPIMMEQNKGSIILTSSVAGLKGDALACAYTASKHAVMGLMKTAALEGADHGIRVNCVNPGPIDTRMVQSLEQQLAPDDPISARHQYFFQRIPLKRYGQADEVAKLMLFLGSDDSSFCTGSHYLIDGGWCA